MFSRCASNSRFLSKLIVMPKNGALSSNSEKKKRLGYIGLRKCTYRHFQKVTSIPGRHFDHVPLPPGCWHLAGLGTGSFALHLLARILLLLAGVLPKAPVSGVSARMWVWFPLGCVVWLKPVLVTAINCKNFCSGYKLYSWYTQCYIMRRGALVS